MKEQPVFVHQPYGLALASRLASLIDKEQLDIIHCHYAIPHVNSALLAREMAKKKDVGIVVTLHGTDITLVGKENTMKNVTNFLLNKCDAVVSVSNFLRNETISLFELNKEVEVIYNFLDDDFLKKISSPSERKRTSERWILHSSTLREVKAPLDVISIFEIIKRKTSNPIRLIIAGDGPLRGAMEEKVFALGLENSVSFLGEVKDMASLYSRCCFCLLPSYVETFGLVALESMAYGIPVLAAKSGGIPEIITDGENGVWFENRNLEEGAEKVFNLIENKDLYKKMSLKARKTALEKFPIGIALKKYDNVYKEALKTRKAKVDKKCCA